MRHRPFLTGLARWRVLYAVVACVVVSPSVSIHLKCSQVVEMPTDPHSAILVAIRPQIGKGSYGTVYLATYRGAQVAVKVRARSPKSS